MSFTYNNKVVGEGIPLIFQHGLAANLNQIIGLLDGIKNVKLAVMDCPGHGLSRLEDVTPSFDNYTDLVVRFLDHLGIERAVVGGLSMGSGIALNLCLRYPDRVTALILHRPAWLDSIDPKNLMILKEAIPYMRSQDGLSEFQQTKSYVNIESRLQLAAKSIAGVFSEEQQADLPTVLDKMVGDKPFDNVESLRSINVPCLILANDDDPLHPYSMREIIHDNISNSVLKKVTSRYIDGEMHIREVKNYILDFIQKL